MPRPARDGGRPPTLSLAAGAAGSRSVPACLQCAPSAPAASARRAHPGRRVGGARPGGWGGGVPEVTDSAGEAGAANGGSGTAELRGPSDPYPLSPGSNRKSQLLGTGLFEALSTHFGLLVQRRLVHTLLGLLQICLHALEDCPSVPIPEQAVSSVCPTGLFSQRICKPPALRGASHPPHFGCLSSSLSSKDLCPPSFSFYPGPHSFPRPSFEV